MNGRLRMRLAIPKSEHQLALEAAITHLTGLEVANVGDRKYTDVLSLAVHNRPACRVRLNETTARIAKVVLQDTIARIAYAVENPDASLRWIDGEGFRLFGDNGDEEVLFKLSREERP